MRRERERERERNACALFLKSSSPFSLSWKTKSCISGKHNSSYNKSMFYASARFYLCYYANSSSSPFSLGRPNHVFLVGTTLPIKIYVLRLRAILSLLLLLITNCYNKPSVRRGEFFPPASFEEETFEGIAFPSSSFPSGFLFPNPAEDDGPKFLIEGVQFRADDKYGVRLLEVIRRSEFRNARFTSIFFRSSPLAPRRGVDF